LFSQKRRRIAVQCFAERIITEMYNNLGEGFGCNRSIIPRHDEPHSSCDTYP
jgi:hypothetical protein